MNVIDYLLVIGITFMSLWASYICFDLARTLNKPKRWIQFGMSGILMAWFFFYLLVGLDAINFLVQLDRALAKTWVLRPLVLITISLIAASSRARRTNND